ncbi:MAG: hypothetical protein M3O62_03305, partial [Pseudomonadota bacterium]|nr:hypothetical protein [Pseudomonadota bacterium]
DQDYTLDATKQWRIDGVVKVGEGNVELADAAAVAAVKAAGATLTIPAGLTIKAFDDASLLVTRGSRLEAVGTAEDPITFSSLDDNISGLGEWGGIVIQGFAPQFGKEGTGACFGVGTVCNVDGEGGDFIGKFGGNEPADDSGTVKYVRIAEGGLIAGPNNEVNGLTLQGVGYGTTIDFVQVHNNLDDGIEWFGGTVNATHIVLTGNDDDDIDFDEGYKGNIQFAIVKKNPTKAAPTGSNDPRGIEANSSDNEFAPETDAVLANVTVVGGPAANNEAGAGQQPGMRLRGALTVSIFNSAVSGFDTGCIRIDDADTDLDGDIDENSTVALTNVLGDCEDGFYDKRAADSETNAVASALTFDDAFAITQPAASLAGAPAITAVNPASGFIFEQTDYVGAVEPGTSAEDAWWAGWTITNSVK